ncbi:hypothetical protein D4Q85_00475 [bacterium]|nr:MAG: hypothetical protein D4Q85_00475 [bacterium]
MVFNSAFLLRFAMKQPRLPGKFSAIVLAPLDSFTYFLAPSFQLSHEDTNLPADLSAGVGTQAEVLRHAGRGTEEIYGISASFRS